MTTPPGCWRPGDTPVGGGGAEENGKHQRMEMQGEKPVVSGDLTTGSRRTQLGKYSTGFPPSDLLGLTFENLLS